MTSTLKSFQAEIEKISHVKHAEAIKQAKEAHAAAELAKHHGKKVVVKDESEAEVVEVDEGVTLEVSLGSRGSPTSMLRQSHVLGLT